MSYIQQFWGKSSEYHDFYTVHAGDVLFHSDSRDWLIMILIGFRLYSLNIPCSPSQNLYIFFKKIFNEDSHVMYAMSPCAQSISIN